MFAKMDRKSLDRIAEEWGTRRKWFGLEPNFMLRKRLLKSIKWNMTMGAPTPPRR